MIPSYYKFIAVAVLQISIPAGSYYFGYQHGALTSTEACNIRMNDYQQTLAAKISNIEQDITNIADAGNQREAQLADDITEILARVKKKPVTIVKNGQCNPSATFVDSINQAISKANSK